MNRIVIPMVCLWGAIALLSACAPSANPPQITPPESPAPSPSPS
ncbi:MAG: hypothetical protein NW220_19860 [Leptolyngbyaceae cyanobacterium bins.349]|nr:hypothetical protein [Leptolyngbyaceae cyanobacterium bins.349]